MLLALAISIVLVLLVVLLHYEALRFTSSFLPRLTIRPRQRILVVILAAFCAHLIEVWLYALAFYLLAGRFGIGSLSGSIDYQFLDYLYLSTESYTSLGYGDVIPLGGLRLMTGIETIIGLMMIGWSASFTYLAMEKFWDLHRSGRV